MTYGLPTAGTPADVPVCPRHPDRVSYVRCQRCGRPACPQCQRSAAVGIQCVDCVNQAARTAPVHRTSYGGAVAAGRPLATYVIIALCVAVYLLEWVIPHDAIFLDFAYAPFLTESEPWRMITSAFLHSQGVLLHIVFNMYALWILGSALEPVLGRVRYVALYMLSAVAGSVGVLLLTPVDTPVVGASGAIFGLFGALFVIQRHRGGSVRQIVILIAINAVIGFLPGSNIAWQAHLGGLIAGGLGAAVLAYAPKGARRSLIQWSGLALLLLIMIGLTVVRTAMIHSQVYGQL
ncbi:MAG TPA: rhomboid family intramembrane serine protease [Micrococcaceae bacterium]|jgi:membrane associated rhomboid family serine protease|nr:rhomboid family intramembrane serine protease [Micrococcaceae bacterium]